MDGANLGWWVVVLPVAVPFLLLLVVHLLARLESWMFAPDERADKVQRLLAEVETPDQIEAEVAKLLSDVPETAAEPGPHENGSSRTDKRRGWRAGRVDRNASRDRRGDRRARLRQVVDRAPTRPRRTQPPQ